VEIEVIIDMETPEVKFNGEELEVQGRSIRLGRHNTRGEQTGPTLTGMIFGLLDNLRIRCGDKEGARRQDEER
jgi:hypothetical protein